MSLWTTGVVTTGTGMLPSAPLAPPPAEGWVGLVLDPPRRMSTSPATAASRTANPIQRLRDIAIIAGHQGSIDLIRTSIRKLARGGGIHGAARIMSGVCPDCIRAANAI